MNLKRTIGAEIHEFYKKVKGHFYLPSQGFQIWIFLKGMDVGIKCKISAQYIKICLLGQKITRTGV